MQAFLDGCHQYNLNKEQHIYSYSRYIFTADETEQESSFGAIDSTLFNVSRVSHKNESPLMSRLLIYPVNNGLNGTKVNCTDKIGDAANNATASTITIITRGHSKQD